MQTVRQLGANSAIYVATNLMQKGAAFLLMPLYTAFLDPSAFGVLAVVTGINGMLGIAFTLSLTGAVTRFYFEYQDDPATLAEFWGSILCFVLLLSAVLGGLLLLVGDRVLAPVLGDVPFWPYVALGILTTFFQPFLLTYLSVLQTRNQAGKYAAISLAHFGLMTALTIALVVFLRRGAVGALSAILIATAVFFVVSFWMMRADLRLSLRWRHLRPALAYCLPQVPHAVAGQTTAIADRLILNSRLGTAATGVYSVGAMISMVVDVAAQSVNRAYVPLSMRALKSLDPEELRQLQLMGSLIVAAFCLLGAFVGGFSREIVTLLTAASFEEAATVVPILAFSGAASAIYYLFVSVLFFDRSAIRLLPVGTLTGALVNVALALALIPQFGMIGAAVAALVAQSLATILVAMIGRRFDPVRWEYGRYALAFASGLGCALLLGGMDVEISAASLAAKLAVLLALCALLGFVLWRRPLILAVAVIHLLRRRSDQAAALFSNARPPA